MNFNPACVSILVRLTSVNVCLHLEMIPVCTFDIFNSAMKD